jgi:hypothetical protein
MVWKPISLLFYYVLKTKLSIYIYKILWFVTYFYSCYLLLLVLLLLLLEKGPQVVLRRSPIWPSKNYLSVHLLYFLSVSLLWQFFEAHIRCWEKNLLHILFSSFLTFLNAYSTCIFTVLYIILFYFYYCIR